MLLDCYGPTPRGAVDVAAVAHYAGVSPSTVRRWLSKPPTGISAARHSQAPAHPTATRPGGSGASKRTAVPARAQRSRVDRRRTLDPAGMAKAGLARPAHRRHHRDPRRPWLQVAVTNGSRRALGEMHRRGATVDNLIVPTRFHAQVLAHAVMVRQQAWRVHPVAHRLSAGRTQAWMADAPTVDLSALAAAVPERSTAAVEMAG